MHKSNFKRVIQFSRLNAHLTWDYQAIQHYSGVNVNFTAEKQVTENIIRNSSERVTINFQE